MLRVLIVTGIIAIAAFASTATADRLEVKHSTSLMPLAFTSNQGQWDEKVLFRANAGGASMWFTSDGAYYQFSRRIPGKDTDNDDAPDAMHDRTDRATGSLESIMIKAAFVGANPNPRMVGQEIMEYKCNYFIGNDPEKWRTDVANYRAVIYEGIYDGIDLKYYGNGKQMEYDFIVSPGADPSQIQVQYTGAQSVEVDALGRLVVRTEWGEVTEQPPIIYQLVNGQRRSISGEYALQGDNTFGFSFADNYDPDFAVVIDPILSYSTYLGGSNHENGVDIAVDNSGNAYITGVTWSGNFPTQNPYQSTHGGGATDAFVTKLDASGSTLLYSTYFGGSNGDQGEGIAVDINGIAHITGMTASANFPTQNAHQSTYGGGQSDAFVVMLNPSGNILLCSSYLGGSLGDYGTGIAVDYNEDAHISGYTYSADFPTFNAYQAVFGGSRDAFVTKLDNSGSTVTYSTYLGGSGSDIAEDIAVDNNGNNYVTGYTGSTNFPTQNPYQPTNGGGDDAFVSKLSNTGSALVFSTYLGGSGYDGAWSIAVDNVDDVWLTGQTSSLNFPTQNPYQPTHGGSGSPDAFVTVLASPGTTLIYSTYLGGSGQDWGYGIAVDLNGNAFVTGETHSTNFPTLTPFQASHAGGITDAFVTSLNSSSTGLLYSTYLGGSGDEGANGIAVDNNSAAYVTGPTNSTDFPTLNPYQATNGGINDAFVTKLAIDSTGSIHGVKWEYWWPFDCVAQQTKVQTLQNWPIQLSPGGQTVFTDGSGSYSFTNLLPGTYTVSENVQPGWIQDCPISGSYTVTVGPGQIITGLDFLNVRLDETISQMDSIRCTVDSANDLHITYWSDTPMSISAHYDGPFPSFQAEYSKIPPDDWSYECTWSGYTVYNGDWVSVGVEFQQASNNKLFKDSAYWTLDGVKVGGYLPLPGMSVVPLSGPGPLTMTLYDDAGVPFTISDLEIGYPSTVIPPDEMVYVPGAVGEMRADSIELESGSYWDSLLVPSGMPVAVMVQGHVVSADGEVYFIAQHEHDTSTADCPIPTVDPSPGEVAAPRDGNIMVEFDIEMDPTTIDSSSFTVYGSLSGFMPGTVTYDAPSRTATWDGEDFGAGEEVSVMLTTDITASGGAPLCGSHGWSFYAAAPADGYTNDILEWPQVAGNPRGIVAADFDGDGATDVLTSNNGDNSVSFLRNHGGPYETDILEPRIDYAAGSGPWGVCVADFNQDGNPDVATANNGDATISILMNNGGPYETDILEPRVDYPVNSGPRGIVAADFNGDGYPDLVTGNSGNEVSVLLNAGDGTFDSHVEYATPSDHYDVYAYDVNGDYAADIIAPNYGSNSVSVFLNNGNGTFADDTVYATGSHPTAVVYAPGFPLVAGDIRGAIAVTDWMSNTVSILGNNGDGTFAPRTTNAVAAGPHAICAHDLEGDGDLDLATANYHADSVSILRNVGEGVFEPYIAVPTRGGPVAIVAADFNGDGFIDLATANYDDDNVGVIVIVHEGCCGLYTDGITGNTNCSEDGKFTLSDITKLIDHVYISKDPLCCMANGNTNGSEDCKITLSDITVLIDAVYISHVPPAECMPECEE